MHRPGGPGRRRSLPAWRWSRAHSRPAARRSRAPRGPRRATCFEAALAEAETPEALSGLGTAARWERDAPAALSAHERGYRLARSLGDDRAAAALALDLVFDCFDFRGPAEARGWLERAGRLLADLPPGYEHGLHAYLRANLALSLDHDPATARALAAEAVALARAGGSSRAR